MPLIGSYSIAPTYTERYSNVDDLLVQLPDNTSNSIVAQDVRDAVYTLWKNIEDVSIVAASAASASAYFQNSNATPVTVGGIAAGSTFSTPKTLQEMFDLLLYPYIAPGASITGLSNRQYGNSLSVTLNWTATKNSNSITSITVDGFPQVPTGNTQLGSQLTSGTHSITPAVSQINTFNMSVGDGTSTTPTSTTLTWMNNRYWGYVDLSSLGNPDLTANPGSASSVGSYITDTIIKNLTGANANAQLFGKELSTTKSKTYTGIDGAGKHLVFAWPSTVASPYTPTFTVNGLPNSAFTQVRTNSVFSNEYGFNGTNYEVWVSNTLQNSPLNIVIS